MFAIKAEFKYRPFLMIGLGIVCCLFVLGSSLRVLEQPYVGD